MRVSTEQSGQREWLDALRLMELRVLRATHQATTKAVRMVSRSVTVHLMTYRHAPGTPTPAPPGGPPAMVSGDLARSQHIERTRSVRRGVYGGATGPTRAYARAQELGGLTGRNYRTRLPARPYQKPQTRAELARIHNIYRQAWTEATRT